jgi:threonine/homoserine/homoserine lactone efflux protein
VLVGLGNPKMAMFFLAFFPQFVHRAEGATYLALAGWAAISGA